MLNKLFSKKKNRRIVSCVFVVEKHGSLIKQGSVSVLQSKNALGIRVANFLD